MDIEQEKALHSHTEHTIGHVFIMTHSIFSDVVRVGCTPCEPEEYAQLLSSKVPGKYQVAYSQVCDNPCKVKQQVKDSLKHKTYINEFYQVPVEVAAQLIKREAGRIPIQLQ